jgi:hypothetical protein
LAEWDAWIAIRGPFGQERDDARQALASLRGAQFAQGAEDPEDLEWDQFQLKYGQPDRERGLDGRF